MTVFVFLAGSYSLVLSQSGGDDCSGYEQKYENTGVEAEMEEQYGFDCDGPDGPSGHILQTYVTDCVRDCEESVHAEAAAYHAEKAMKTLARYECSKCDMDVTDITQGSTILSCNENVCDKRGEEAGYASITWYVECGDCNDE